MFAKSAVAGSRPVCDLGWLDYRHQVGLTGARIAPQLYIACGISGAAQHLAGMRERRVSSWPSTRIPRPQSSVLQTCASWQT
ncbi:MAG: FAD-binding protein [Deltaproteobacteria bacterium]|nr:FAD-binding protein [Deltaproteobacteria bacterium]